MTGICTRSHRINVKSFTIVYSIIKNKNTIDSDMHFAEYGISCVAFSKDGTISSSDEIKCISPYYHKVLAIFDILKRNQVFPNHLKDIVSDLLEELPFEDEFVHHLESA